MKNGFGWSVSGWNWGVQRNGSSKNIHMEQEGSYSLIIPEEKQEQDEKEEEDDNDDDNSDDDKEEKSE